MTNTDAGIRPEYVGNKEPAILRAEIQRIFDLQPHRPGRPNADDFSYWIFQVVASVNGWDSYWVFNKMLAGVDLATLNEAVPFPMPGTPHEPPPPPPPPPPPLDLVAQFMARLDAVDKELAAVEAAIVALRTVQAQGLVIPYLGTARPPK